MSPDSRATSDSTGSLALERAFGTVAREAFRSAINLWPAMQRHACVVSVSGPGYELSTTLRFGPEHRSKLFPISITVDAEELALASTSLADLLALGGRLGRHCVYDMGLADGV